MTDPTTFTLTFTLPPDLLICLVGILACLATVAHFAARRALILAEYRGWERGFAEARGIWRGAAGELVAARQAEREEFARVLGEMARDGARKVPEPSVN